MQGAKVSDKSLADKAIDIKGKKYVLVSDRIVYFNEEYSDGSIETAYDLLDKMFIVKAVIRPHSDKPQKFTGLSQAIIGDGMVNKTAALENAETSAVGRALAMMGIGVIDSIASVDEINKATGSTGVNPATDKQINMLREIAQRITGLEDGEDLDKWIEKATGFNPHKLSTKAVFSVMNKLKDAQVQKQEEERTANEKPDEIVDVGDEPITLDDIPF